MAQNFRRYVSKNVGKSAAQVFSANSYDTIIGISLANTTSSQVFVDAYIEDADSSNNIYLIKNAPIHVGSQLQLIDGGAKVVVKSGDVLTVISDSANSVDAVVSCVDAIST